MKILKVSLLAIYAFAATMSGAATPLTYTNPVLKGFFPDPSTICVGEDFYTINSTFQYFPALVISHSKDLVHWEQVSCVFNEDNPIDLRHFYDGCGIWAPDISYHDGEFYVFYCLVQLKKDRSVNVRGNYMTKAPSVYGPWSKPVQITDNGSDPSHFVDENGDHYMLYAAGIPKGNGTKIVKLNNECTKVVEGPFWMETDGRKSAPEGPHLLKKDGWYYFMMAASSGAYSGHHQLLARSKKVYGPYESYPGNPFVAQYNENAINKQLGHGKMFCTPNGDWYITVISQRRDESFCNEYSSHGFTQLGRETSLYPVAWGEDGWPKVCDTTGLADTLPFPNLPYTPLKTSQSDDFSSSKLGMQWFNVRNPIYEERLLCERQGWLRLYTGNFTLDDIQARNIILQRETDKNYTAITKMEFRPATVEQAGILCYYDSQTYISYSLRTDPQSEEGDCMLVVEEKRGRERIKRIVAETRGVKSGVIYLKVKVDGLRRMFYYSYDNIKWEFCGREENAYFLSDEGTPEWGFMGTMVGVYALNYGSGSRIPADFDYFSYETPKRVKIMGIGDSITQGGSTFTSYVGPLARMLEEQGIDYEFVGPRIGKSVGVAYHHFAFGGKNTEYIDQHINPVIREYMPDIVLIHSGHNHFIEEKPIRGIVKAHKSIIKKIRKCRKDALILVAGVIESGKLPKYSYIPQLNIELEAMVKDMNDSNICFVDVGEDFDWERHTIPDHVHPNDDGARVMAANWMKALMRFMHK